MFSLIKIKSSWFWNNIKL